jgi:hypothetical protein
VLAAPEGRQEVTSFCRFYSLVIHGFGPGTAYRDGSLRPVNA